MIIRLVREYPPRIGETGVVHVDVDGDGEMTVLGDHEAVPQKIAMEILGVRDHYLGWQKSQLTIIRHLALNGWRVADPSLWLPNREAK